MITVGATSSSGRYWTKTTPEGPLDQQHEGSITVWAQGKNVWTVGLEGVTVEETGTSFAAPQVAGLAAYILGLYPNTFTWAPNQGYAVAMHLKRYIVRSSYRRIPMEDQLTSGTLPYALPRDINVAYNDYWGPQQPCDRQGSGNRPRDEINPDDLDYSCPLPPNTFLTSTAAPPTPATTAPPTPPTEDPTPTTAAPPTPPTEAPTPTSYYHGPDVDGCANDECSSCASGFTQQCTNDDQNKVVNCVCTWDSGCKDGVPNRGSYSPSHAFFYRSLVTDMTAQANVTPSATSMRLESAKPMMWTPRHIPSGEYPLLPDPSKLCCCCCCCCCLQD
ncbi:hypothetical protein F4778DRAFT_750332 [Xylariomycetidae sp. FL2044]|nr:hypothetical protein F4778DRAFT_750332 [Xylariomycetidae sp. FL2044]